MKKKSKLKSSKGNHSGSQALGSRAKDRSKSEDLKVVKSKSKKVKTIKNKFSGTSSKSSSKYSTKFTQEINKDFWPQERELLFRPERLKYVRKLIKHEGCVFCASRDMGLSSESLCIYKSDHSMVILNKFPYNPGHLLVLPQKHAGDLLTLTDAEYTDLQMTVRKSMAIISEAYHPSGINLGLNHGAVAGAGIPEHLHYHLIPRWAGDTNFFPLIAETKVLVEDVAQTFERLRKYFQEEK